jgi:hypothetical protein
MCQGIRILPRLKRLYLLYFSFYAFLPLARHDTQPFLNDYDDQGVQSKQETNAYI